MDLTGFMNQTAITLYIFCICLNTCVEKTIKYSDEKSCLYKLRLSHIDCCSIKAGKNGTEVDELTIGICNDETETDKNTEIVNLKILKETPFF